MMGRSVTNQSAKNPSRDSGFPFYDTEYGKLFPHLQHKKYYKGKARPDQSTLGHTPDNH